MVVLILENVPVGLRGEITRWLLEPHSGVFVGNVSAMVRDRLWELASEKRNVGGCLMIHTTNNEQGFDMRVNGAIRRKVVDIEGLKLIAIG
ncbi:MAG: type I-E CRISPR-associated endoribonuclease Cas2e [Actinomycetota bacterium]|nr:type I-E CRISPR-associated endoribonuclease Cas2e [Actinomycetota bacterium]